MKGLLKMKLNENFLIHQSDNGEILIPVGDETKRFHGVVKLNDTGSEIVHLLENNDLSLEDVLNHFYSECPNDDREEIKKGVRSITPHSPKGLPHSSSVAISTTHSFVIVWLLVMSVVSLRIIVALILEVLRLLNAVYNH